MKKYIVLLLVLIVSPLMAKHTYYLIPIDSISPLQFQSMKDRLNIDTNNKFENLQCYVYNNPDKDKATRCIVECDSAIEDKAELSIFIIGKLVKKLWSTEQAIEDGRIVVKTTTFMNYPLNNKNPDWWNPSLEIYIN